MVLNAERCLLSVSMHVLLNSRGCCDCRLSWIWPRMPNIVHSLPGYAWLL